jgi:hypothetical protein
MSQSTPSWKESVGKGVVWDVAGWAVTLGSFGMALVRSYHEIHYNIPNDLRSPTVLLIDALLAMAVAFGFAVRQNSLERWSDVHFCFRFGFWAAAVFRLVPPILNEDILYLKNCGSFDVQYGVLGALVHGGLAFLLARPFAIRVFNRSTWTQDESLSEMCGAVILVFFITAGVVRLLAEHW